MSWSLAVAGASGVVRFVSTLCARTDLSDWTHLWISEWPSAKAKPAAALWYEAGWSTHWAGYGLKKPASLMLQGCSSRKTHVSVGPGKTKSETFLMCL